MISSSDGFEVADDDLRFDKEEILQIIARQRSQKYAVRQLITRHRVQKSQTARDRQVKKALDRALANGCHSSHSTIRCDTELHLDREEEARKRAIASSNPPWRRTIIAWEGPCYSTWGEVQVGASMGEEGIEWMLTSVYVLFV